MMGNKFLSKNALAQAVALTIVLSQAACAGTFRSALSAGINAFERKDYKQAQACFRASLTESERAGTTSNTMEALAWLSKTLFEAGQYKEAAAVAGRLLSMREQKAPDDKRALSESLILLGTALEEDGQFKPAEPILERALHMSRQIYSPNDPQLAKALVELSELYQHQTRYALAEPLLVEAARIYREGKGQAAQVKELARARNNLAVLYQDLGKYAEAETLYKKALKATAGKSLDREPDAAKTFRNLAVLYEQQCKFSQAEAYYERALAIDKFARGETHPDVAEDLAHLAILDSKMARYTKAESEAKQALAIAESKLGENHPSTGYYCNILAVVYKNQGKYKEAEPLYRKALAMTETYGPSHPKVALSLNTLAIFLEDVDQFAEAEALAKRAIAISTAKFGDEHAQVARCMQTLAELKHKQGQYDEAKEKYERVLAMRERLQGAQHRDVAATLTFLAVIAQDQGHLKSAYTLYHRALAIRRKVLGPNHPDTARTIAYLAQLSEAMGKYPEAETLYRQALTIDSAVYGWEHPVSAQDLKDLAIFLSKTKRYAEEEPLIRRALAITHKIYGPNHSDYAANLNALAVLKKDQGLYADAEPLYKKSLEIRRKLKGPGNAEVAGSLNSLAVMYEDTGRYAEARALLEEGLAIRRKKFGNDSPRVANSLRNLARLSLLQGKYTEAESRYRQALSIQESKLGSDHPEVALTLTALAGVLKKEGDIAEAERLYQKAYAIDDRLASSGQWTNTAILTEIAELLVAQGKYAQAESMLNRSLSLTRESYGQAHPKIAEVLAGLSRLHTRQGDYAQAEAEVSGALAMTRSAYGDKHPDVASLLDQQSAIYRETGRTAEAEACAQQSLAVRRDILGKDHPLVADSLSALALAYSSRGEYAKAQPLLEAALASRERKLGQKSVALVPDLEQLAWLNSRTGNRALCGALYRRARLLREQATAQGTGLLSALALSPGTQIATGQADSTATTSSAQTSSAPESAAHLEALASARQGANAGADALALYEKALALKEQSYGADDPAVAQTLMHIARLLEREGGQEAAANERERAFAIWSSFARELQAVGVSAGSPAYESKLGRLGGPAAARLVTAESLVDCANYMAAGGDHRTARATVELALGLFRGDGGSNQTIPVFMQAAEFYRGETEYAQAVVAAEAAIKEAEASKRPKDLMTGYALLARLKLEQGDAVRAREAALAALAACKMAGTALDTVNINVLLAQCSEASGDVGAALAYAQQAATSVEQSGKSGLSSLPPALIALAQRFSLIGRHEEAEQSLSRARQLATEGKDDCALADIEYAAGLLDLKQDRLLPARQHLAKALEMHGTMRTSRGPWAVIDDLNALSQTDYRSGDSRSAGDLTLKASALLDAYLGTVFPQLSFAEQCSLAERVHAQTSRILSFCRDNQRLKQAYGFLIRWKGLLIEALHRQTVLSQKASTPENQSLVAQLRQVRSGLALLCRDGPVSPIEPSRDEFARRKESLERQLAQTWKSAQITDPAWKIDASALASLLAPDAVLVDILAYSDYREHTPRSAYAAVITEHAANPTLVDLGAGDELDALAGKWMALASMQGDRLRGLTANSQESGLRRDVLLRPSAHASQKARTQLVAEEQVRSSLVAALWNPVEKFLPPTAGKVWICPDGITARLPWNALVNASPGPLLCEVDSVRELMAADSSAGTENGRKQALLAGGINFGDPANIPELPATKVEVEAIAKIAGAKGIEPLLLTGNLPTKETVTRELPASTLAHLATHGFFDDSDTTGSGGPSVDGQATLRQIGSRNPLTSSGIYLSKGPYAPVVPGSKSSSALTAEELIGLDLTKVELVALSACETGLGRSLGGQGVVGLRSAIMGAGAHCLLMSMWKVDDPATARLMQEFYERLMTGGMSRAEALRQAQEAVRNSPGGKWKHPYFWAGWVLAGQGF